MDEQDSQGTCQLRFTWKNSRWTEVIVDLWHDCVLQKFQGSCCQKVLLSSVIFVVIISVVVATAKHFHS